MKQGSFFFTLFVITMISKSKLSISIHEAEFSKDFRYKITVAFEKQKKQTDISALARNPIFINNTQYFDLPSNHTVQGSLLFIVHILVDEAENRTQNDKVITRILGECSLDLSPFALQPSEVYHLPIRQQLKFVRSKEGKQVTVGRFIASIKIVSEDSLPKYIEDLEQKKVEKNEYYAPLPDFDESMSFEWRVRVEVREALNIPLTDGLIPQVSVEVGWSEYKDTMPEEKRIIRSDTLNSSHPEWHQTMLITNPPHIKDPRGFIMIVLRDSHNLQDIFKVYLPLESMGAFLSYNIRLFRDKEESLSPIEFYFSVLLEQAGKDRLYDVVVQDIVFEPQVLPFKQMNLAMVLNSQNEPKIKFCSFNPKEDSIQRILEFDQAEEFTYTLSQTMRVPPLKTGAYRAATVFTLSEAMLRKKINFFLIGRPQKGQYKVAGLAESVQKDLISLLVEKLKKKLFVSVRNHPSVKFGSCQLQIGSPDPTPSMAGSRASNRGDQTASEKLMKQLNFSNNESMLRHVAQNNQIITRILRELDDKSESLRQAAAEISDLRGRVKLLQNENSILRQQALREEDELVSLVQRQVQNMGVRQLKEKIVKMSQLYKMERVRSRQLDKTIKLMEPQISNTMQLNSVVVAQKNTIQNLTEKTERMAKEQQRINIYKETIKKQEKVIAKLEKVMREGMDEVRNARKTRLQLEQLKKGREGEYRGSSRSQNKDQIERLQGIIAQLQANTKLGGSTREGDGFGGNSYELQFKLHQAETRIASLQDQLQQKSRSYGRQLAMLRMRLAEKEAVMDGFMH